MSSNEELLRQAAESGDPLAMELARRLGWALVHWQELAKDVDAALAAKATKGGQHAGTPRLANVPTSLLVQVKRAAEAAQGEPEKLATLEALRQALAQR